MPGGGDGSNLAVVLFDLNVVIEKYVYDLSEIFIRSETIR